MQTRLTDERGPTTAAVPTVNLDWNGRREPAWYEGHQRILNAHEVPKRFTQARAPIPVRARLEWEHDGVELTDTVATAWTHSLALVAVDDARSRFRGVWVDIGEVVRR
ncbi:hypothetical protein ATJ97_0210 [Georgenia soli]|uniref:Uncharacterized protein n=1 Tax=Georgenia soli TaxID=638953 RepID=A0A2A9F0W2_9MICO|nr:hypothetical protein [Georgenia soli]PFG44934.1 hypothetical protein ATJ97_0210 [Georgenia soli]